MISRQIFEQIKSKQLAVPHKTQLSRARLKLDILIMLERQKCWANLDCEGYFVYLSGDASPQGSLEYFVVLEDRVSRQEAGMIVEATESELREWCSRAPLQTATLPCTILGTGNATMAGKFDSLTHAAALDCMHNGDVGWLAAYSKSVVGFCSDWGAEGHLCQETVWKLIGLN